MAKQNIYIGSRSGNRRIERAIPEFMNRFGFAKDQATAVAIRLESLGRLDMDGDPIKKGMPVALVAQVLKALKTDGTAKRTQIRQSSDLEGDVYESPFQARAAMSKTTRSNRLRSRVTRGR